jgi:3-methyladenine DNA glycosylase AlkD
VLAGMLMDVAAAAQRDFPPNVFNRWLDHLQGWAEIDAVCTGSFTIEHVPERLDEWESWLVRFSKSKVIAKRRASLVILCSPVSHVKDGRLSDLAFRNILTLQNEKDVLITKAISWLLRSMIKHYGKEVKTFLMLNEGTLPKIAVRETRAKLETGLKTKRKDE